MRRIHNLQTVIKVIDGYRMQLIADIIVYEKSNQSKAIVNKRNGEILVSNIDKGVIQISCVGYMSKIILFEYQKSSSEVQIVKLYYAPHHISLKTRQYINFILKNKDIILGNTKITIGQTKSISILRIIEDGKKGDRLININCEYSKFLLMCDVRYKEETFILDGYDHKAKRYEVSKGLPCDIEPSQYLYLWWEMESDSRGNVIFPINSLFFDEDCINLVFNEKQEKEVYLQENCTFAEINMEE